MRRPLILAVLVVVALGGCLTPSIPIPPPDAGMMTFRLSGEPGMTGASFEYPPNINYVDAVVFVFNRDRGTGIIDTARADGSVGPTTPVAAALGEQIVVTFQREDQTVSTCIRLREGQQSSTDYCGP